MEYQFCCSVKDIKGRDCRGREKHRLWSLKNLLASREVEDVAEWLRCCPNIRIVVSSVGAGQLDRIIGEYSAIGRVYDAVSGFKQALSGKKESELDKWLEETGSLEYR